MYFVFVDLSLFISRKKLNSEVIRGTMGFCYSVGFIARKLL